MNFPSSPKRDKRLKGGGEGEKDLARIAPRDYVFLFFFFFERKRNVEVDMGRYFIVFSLLSG